MTTYTYISYNRLQNHEIHHPSHPHSFQALIIALNNEKWEEGVGGPARGSSNHRFLTYGGDEGGVEGVIWKPEEYACLSHAWVAYEEQLE